MIQGLRGQPPPQAVSLDKWKVENETLTQFTFSISNTSSTYNFSYNGHEIGFADNAYKIPDAGDFYAFFMLNKATNHTFTIYDRSDTDSPFWETAWTNSPSLKNFTYEAAPVPVPAAVWLLGTGLVGLRRKFGKK